MWVGRSHTELRGWEMLKSVVGALPGGCGRLVKEPRFLVRPPGSEWPRRDLATSKDLHGPTSSSVADRSAMRSSASGDSVALLAPTVNTFVMNRHLRMISKHVGRDVHVVLVLDQAGWHRSKGLAVPANITLLPLPPYSSELNPIERLWAWFKSHQFSNRMYADYDEMLNFGTTAWNTQTPERLKTVCHAGWLKRDD